MIITAATTKDEIVSSACELIDAQTSTIDQLKQQQKTLLIVLAISVIYSVLF